MPVMPYLYEDPSSIAVRLIGASVPAEELVSDEQAVRRGSELLEAALRENRLRVPDDLLDAVIAYHAAAAMASKSGSPRLVRALAEATGEHARTSLSGASPRELVRTARMLGLPVERSQVSIPWIVERGRVVPLRLEYNVPLARYLRVASGSGGMLSLANSFLRGGRVYMDKRRLVELIALAAKARAVRIIDRYRGAELGKKLVDEALRLAARAETGGGGGGLDWEALPGCVRRIIEEGARSDLEAYMLISFLAAVRPSRDSLARALLRSGLASARSLENLVDAVLSLRGVSPYKCDSEPGRQACPEGCGEGAVREYFRARSTRRGQDRGRRSRPGWRGAYGSPQGSH